jgi:cytoskeleton protein RodZ
VQEPVQNVPAPELKPGEPGGPPAEPSAGASMSLAPSAPSAQPALPDGVKRLKLSFAKQSWVTVKDADGATLLNELNAPGTEKIVEAKAPISLVAGNASGVTATLDGEPLKLQPQRNDIAKLRVD